MMTFGVVMGAIALTLIVWIAVLKWRLRTHGTTVRVANAAMYAVGDRIFVAGQTWRIASINGDILTCKLEAPRFKPRSRRSA
jgi:hypothetical protein